MASRPPWCEPKARNQEYQYPGLKAKATSAWSGSSLIIALLLLGRAAAQSPEEIVASVSQPIAIARLELGRAVDFGRDLLPVLRKSCLACHNQTIALGGLILETPESVLKGGAGGPVVVPEKSDESLLLQRAAHRVQPFMPPPGNKVGAVALTPDELGLLKLWIDQGATGKVQSPAESQVIWQPLPAGVSPVYAAAISRDGQFVAAGHANRVFVYRVSSGRLLQALADPDLLEAGVPRSLGRAHRDLVQSLAFSPGVDLLASGGYRTVKLWRRPDGVSKMDLWGAGDPVRSLAVSPDGSWAAAGDAGGRITLWELPSGRWAHTFEAHTGEVSQILFGPSKTCLISGSLDGALRIWNSGNGDLVGQAEIPSAIHALALIGQGGQVASGSADGVIRIWPSLCDSTVADSLAPVREIHAHRLALTSLASVDVDGKQLLSGGEDGTVRHWNWAKGEQIQQLDHGAPVTAVAASADGLRFASAGLDSVARLWSSAGGKLLAEMKGDPRLRRRLASLGRALVVANQSIRVMDRLHTVARESWEEKSEASGSAAAKQAKAERVFARKERSALSAVAAREAAERQSSALAKRLAEQKEAAPTLDEKADNQSAAGGRDALAKADVKTKARVLRLISLAEKTIQKARDARKAMAAAADEAEATLQLAQKAAADLTEAQTTLAGAEAVLEEVKADLSTVRKASDASEKPIRSLVFSLDSGRLVMGGDDHLIHIWDSEGGQARDTLEGAGAVVRVLTFSPDGDLLSGSDNNRTVLWDSDPPWSLRNTIGSVDDAEQLSGRVSALAFSPDGQLLATGSGEPSRSGEVKLWDPSQGKLVRNLADAHSDTVFGLEFSPDGKYLASASADRLVKVFDTVEGSVVRVFEGHTHHVLDVAWRADGHLLASCGADNVVKLWDFETGEQRETIAGFEKEITSISFLETGDDLLTSSGDGLVRLGERQFRGGQDFLYTSASSADGQTIIAGGQDGVLRVWHSDGTLLHRLGPPDDSIPE